MANLDNIDGTVGIHSLDDFRPEMPFVSGRTALLHRLAVRLQTPRGRFSWPKSGGGRAGWPNFGTDVRAFLLTKVRPSVVASAIESECLKDEQVHDIRASVEFTEGGKSMVVSAIVFDAEGPFRFTLLASQAKLELIELQEIA